MSTLGRRQPVLQRPTAIGIPTLDQPVLEEIQAADAVEAHAGLADLQEAALAHRLGLLPRHDVRTETPGLGDARGQGVLGLQTREPRRGLQQL
jgi:hypothetical protein